MNNIQVRILAETPDALGTQLFLARLTQRGHKIKSAEDLVDLHQKSIEEAPVKRSLMRDISELPHGTIKRFTPVTVAIVGASRRFLAQARTHQVGMNYVSASLQYSDYSGTGEFVVPYPIIERDYQSERDGEPPRATGYYLDSCRRSLEAYNMIASDIDNDSAGYAMPQGLRNILIMQGNAEAWQHFIRLRACNRNTPETQYVALRIWEALQKFTADGEIVYNKYSCCPPCPYSTGVRCPEGKMACTCDSIYSSTTVNKVGECQSIPLAMIAKRFPLLSEVECFG